LQLLAIFNTRDKIRRMDDEFALLITWTCYGTWLPGDRRGYVSNTRHTVRKFDAMQNVPGTPYTADHSRSRQLAAAAQKHATATLDPSLARVAAQALVDACAARDWRIVRGALMWNHVHVVITNCPDDGPAVRRVLKGVSQSALSEHIGKPRRWWTAGGSDRYKHGEREILAAVNYVANQPNPLAEIVDMQVISRPSERRGLSPPSFE
jgi:REP element-mobilizing transposase RayT